MTDENLYKIYKMEITGMNASNFQIMISRGKLSCSILYHPETKTLEFIDKNQLSTELTENKYQLKKILHNKRSETFYVGFCLKFILRNNENAISLNDLSKLVVLDRRNGDYKIISCDKDEKEILRIYTDGCYLEKKKRGAYIALIKNKRGLLNIHFKQTKAKSSSLIELMAVIKGLELTKDTECVRIISDSRYIIKGLTEWMFNWKLNNWHTAQGRKVKNIAYWKKFDKLSQGKYIEFEWVKAHSKQYENSICDYYAKQAATRIN